MKICRQDAVSRHVYNAIQCDVQKIGVPRQGVRRVHFLHIGKNAGSHLKQVMNRLNDMRAAVQFGGHKHKVPKDNNLLVLADRLDLGTLLNNIELVKRTRTNDYRDMPNLFEQSRTNVLQWYSQDIEFYHIRNHWNDEQRNLSQARRLDMQKA